MIGIVGRVRDWLSRAWRVVSIIAALFGLPFFAGSAAATTVMATQAPCVTAAGNCLTFDATSPIPIVRSFTFNAPAAGVAQVFFHGSMLCGHNGGPKKVVDVASTIFNTPYGAPSLFAASGLRHGLVLEPGSGTETFNLYSQRPFVISAAGPQTYYFKIVRMRMDAGSYCLVFNASFSVIFGN
jgi:hypothetical protein